MPEVVEWWQSMLTSGLAFVSKVPGVAGVVIVGLVSLRLVRGALAKLLSGGRINKSFASLAQGAIGFFGWVLVLAGAANVLGLNELALALGGSIAVVGLGLASGLTGTVTDLIAGLFLLADPDFNVGRRVKSGAIEGIVGTLDIRKTKVVDDEGNLHIIPNRTLDSGTVMIYPEKKAQNST